MVTFDHRETGTAARTWDADPRLGSLPVLDLTGMPRLVVAAAHPDDESLGAGGLLALAEAARTPITVVVATLGEASHPGSPTTSRAELAELRRAELHRAVQHVAPSATVRVLEVPDGQVADHEAAVRAALARVVTAGTWVAAPWRGDAHPDHEAVGRAAASAAADAEAVLLEFPVWAWHWADPGELRLPWSSMHRLPLTDRSRAAKARALDEHRSQVEPLSDLPGDEPVVPAGFRDHFARDHEIFAVTRPAPRRPGTLDPAFFTDFYRAGDDPWGFETRWYERRKRSITMASLPRERFASAFEPGCSIGVLTAELAPRCDRLLATDVADVALDATRGRLGVAPHVVVERRRVPQEWPDRLFDLVVLSEVGYYCDTDDLALLVARAAGSLTVDGVLLACHWRHPVPEYPVAGDEVHAALRAHPGLVPLAQHVEEDFVLDVLTRPPAVSVARAGGLA